MVAAGSTVIVFLNTSISVGLSREERRLQLDYDIAGVVNTAFNRYVLMWKRSSFKL